MFTHTRQKFAYLTNRGIALLGASLVSLGVQAAKPIVHDAEYYVLQKQNAADGARLALTWVKRKSRSWKKRLLRKPPPKPLRKKPPQADYPGLAHAAGPILHRNDAVAL